MDYYPEFERQMKERGVTRFQISKLLRLSPYGLYKKLHGQAPLSLAEAIRIRDEFFPGEGVEELFRVGVEQGT